MKLFKFSNRTDYSKLDILNADKISKILNDYLTPMLANIGLEKWNGKYQWFGKFNQYDIRPVFEFVRLKGLSGTFKYGNCFKYIPTISGTNKLVNHKTDKSVIMHLYEKTDGWYKSFNGEKLTDTVSLINEKDFEKDLKKLWEKYRPKIENWFSVNTSIEENIFRAENQLRKINIYGLNSPSQDLVLSFLYAINGNLNESRKRIDYFFQKQNDLKEDIKLKILELLEKKLVENTNNN